MEGRQGVGVRCKKSSNEGSGLSCDRPRGCQRQSLRNPAQRHFQLIIVHKSLTICIALSSAIGWLVNLRHIYKLIVHTRIGRAKVENIPTNSNPQIPRPISNQTNQQHGLHRQPHYQLSTSQHQRQQPRITRQPVNCESPYLP